MVGEGGMLGELERCHASCNERKEEMKKETEQCRNRKRERETKSGWKMKDIKIRGKAKRHQDVQKEAEGRQRVRK